MRLERFRVKTPGTGAMLARCLLSFCGLLLSVSRPGEAFNLDVENPAVYTGPNGSYFGYLGLLFADSARESL
ncbi:Integrin alpha-V [Dissostichus eleginoides]|uniref:Integrin alpha-V n=1 Tax=Dissostichus eleginoides TaxID=100907 RepID=A0AAD9FAQ2_DISEL|nr:Integrin alpha-V [Dissostichus eleginoides]